MKIDNIMKNKKLEIIELKLEIEKLYVKLDKLKTDYHLDKFEIRNKIRELREKVKELNNKKVAETENIKMEVMKIDDLEEQFKEVIAKIEDEEGKKAE